MKVREEGPHVRGMRETDSVLFPMIIGERFASLAATELCNLCICLETMIEIVRISRSCNSDRVLCVHICVM
jgi:hypothetical protein